MAPQAVTISFRLGGDDGVSVEARKWGWALRELGFETRRVAGTIAGPPEADDLALEGLSIGDIVAPDEQRLADAIAPADLVIVDNLCSLPLNLAAANAVTNLVERHRGRICLRHHDLPWQRRHLRHLEAEFPPEIEGALHATINLRSRRELEARGYKNVTTVHNHFALDAPAGDRDATRDDFGFAPDDFVCFQPARAIERKNVPGGLRFAQQLAALMPDRTFRYWLSGPAEDGYEPTLERILERTPIPVTLGRTTSAADAYAAGDLVVMPSTWEGFGNPIVESIGARRPCAAYPYPVLAELVAAGVRVFSTQHADQVARFFNDTDETRATYYDVNLRRATISFSLADLPGAIEEAFATVGWTSW